ncbi:type-F conjugative transfer system pilin assembly protein TrbC [uncultured Sphingorhabdus sp.]|jgi:conjugal transfer pilus assembly protein TrbC|uniref:type-F conjugative transfer system pilin assembly protein TrbC n=1 Tax=uncultured Sphingorhabdus sp. TaxID=1686106 RepID=UPI00261746B3|nr:type-F conjugative transfer system pilin assembly protein TrbC [uncultured Sphingorhabdus sp.]HMS20517.1 type-F conjugative transfer system pilin assembly protein TrbC [Sphingorhabdus sp.]
MVALRTKIAAVVALVAVSAAVAQTVDGLDLGAIKAKAKGEQAEAQALVDGVKDRGKPHEEEVQRLHDRAMADLAELSPEDFPAGPKGPVDFDELLSGAAGNAAKPQGEAPLFMVFASLSMPPVSLKRLIKDTTRAGGIVVFRGFPNNNAKQFIAGMTKLADSEGDEPNIGIDPRLFRAFNIQAAPTFVVASSDFELCSGFDCVTPVPPHDRLSGNVTVEYVLESFVDSNGPGAAVAAVALRNLKKPG